MPLLNIEPSNDLYILLAATIVPAFLFGLLIQYLIARATRFRLESEIAIRDAQILNEEARSAEREAALASAQQSLANSFNDLAQESLAKNSENFLRLASQKLEVHQEKAKADGMVRAQDMQADIETANREHMAKMDELNLAHQITMAEIAAKAEADISVEMIQSKVNADQQTAAVSNEMSKNQQEHNQSMTESVATHQLKLDEISKSKTEAKEDNDDA